MTDPEEWRTGDDRDMPKIIRHWRERIPLTLSDLISELKQELQISDERHLRRMIQTGRMQRAQVAALGRVLNLNDTELELLFLRAGHTPPVRTPGGVEPVPDTLLRLMHAQPFGAFFEAPDYSCLAYNAFAYRNWPWIAEPGANIMTGLLVGPGRAQCVRADTEWMPLLLAQLRNSVLTSRSLTLDQRERLENVVATVCKQPKIREEWLSMAGFLDQSYGRVRSMRLPSEAWGDDEIPINVEAVYPAARMDLRLVIGQPMDRDEPPLPEGFALPPQR